MGGRGVGRPEALVRRVLSLVRPSSSGAGGRGGTTPGWLAVTVEREPTAWGPVLPAPLAELGDRIEVDTRPAPGGRGTELRARWREQPQAAPLVLRLAGQDPQADLRSALRKAKQLVEVGELLVLDPVPHGRRTATPGGLLVDAWTRIAPRAGVR